MVLLISAIGAQLLIIIGAIFSGWTALRTMRYAQEAKLELARQSIAIEATQRETTAQTPKIDQTLITAAKIDGHVNSEKTKSSEQLISLERENKLLRDVITDKKETAALLAQAASRTGSIQVNGPAFAERGHEPMPKSIPVLESIKDNTAAIEKNTARTDATVNELKKETT